jgi:hypothetical protein
MDDDPRTHGRPRPGTARPEDPDTAERLAEDPDVGDEAGPSRTDPANQRRDPTTDERPEDPTAV